ncbi:MAG TPA: hypothetical protein DCG75_14795 [Bacteroidales bacterium]|nr:hypothetical protein [Bacteroidales bacterium]
MDKSTNIFLKFFNGFKCFARWIRRGIYIVLAALVIGFSNAFYNECRMINDTKNFVEQEQVIDNED